MSVIQELLKFPNLLEVARICGSEAGPYALQDELIAQCRSKGERFLAVMPERHQFTCAICGVSKGEAIMHFEDPGQEGRGSSSMSYWGPAVGAYVDTTMSELHAVYAHAGPMPVGLAELLRGAHT